MTEPGKWFYRLLSIAIIEPDQNSWGQVYAWYVGFNGFEALAWFVFCLFVAFRFIAQRKTYYEILYALSFLAFGVSDLMEMHQTTLGLLAAKGIILMSILACRKVVLNFYPKWKV
jgi:hypothetical protein